jgi:hypothetical protein
MQVALWDWRLPRLCSTLVGPTLDRVLTVEGTPDGRVVMAGTEGSLVSAPALEAQFSPSQHS